MKFIAFWTYDLFPYCIWGELEKADKDFFWVKGFQGCKFNNRQRIAFLPEVQAAVVIEKLKKITADRKAANVKFKKDAEKILKEMA